MPLLTNRRWSNFAAAHRWRVELKVVRFSPLLPVSAQRAEERGLCGNAQFKSCHGENSPGGRAGLLGSGDWIARKCFPSERGARLASSLPHSHSLTLSLSLPPSSSLSYSAQCRLCAGNPSCRVRACICLPGDAQQRGESRPRWKSSRLELNPL